MVILEQIVKAFYRKELHLLPVILCCNLTLTEILGNSMDIF